MSELITTQGHLFLITMGCGVAIGLFYDALRILRRVVVHKNWVINVEDGLFWVISSVFLFIILFKQNGGAIRGYTILGVFIGMVLYFACVSHFLVTFVSHSINGVLKFIGKLIGIFLKPIKKLIKIFISPIKWIITLIKKRTRQNGKRLKKW